jgi:hypothetical protein
MLVNDSALDQSAGAWLLPSTTVKMVFGPVENKFGCIHQRRTSPTVVRTPYLPALPRASSFYAHQAIVGSAANPLVVPGAEI